MIWSIIPAHKTLPLPCWFLSATGMSELDKIYRLAHPSGPSYIPRDLSVKMTLEKSIFTYFLAKCWCYKIFALIRAGCSFTDPNSQSIHQIFSFLTPSIPVFSKIRSQVKCGCFDINWFSLRLSQGNKLLNPFPLLWLLNLVIFSTAFFICKMDIPFLSNFVIFEFLAAARCLTLHFFLNIL